MCFGQVIKNVVKYDLYVKFLRIFFHTMYKYVQYSIVKISMTFPMYFEYYTIILGGGRFFVDTLYVVGRNYVTVIYVTT